MTPHPEARKLDAKQGAEVLAACIRQGSVQPLGTLQPENFADGVQSYIVRDIRILEHEEKPPTRDNLIGLYDEPEASIAKGVIEELLAAVPEEKAKTEKPSRGATVDTESQRQAAASTATPSGRARPVPLSAAGGWPSPPAPEAFYGLAGDIVRAIEPHTESDPAGVLMQLHVAFGNAVGRSAYFLVDKDRHHANLFTALVGPTAKARKGLSYGHVKHLMETADGDWAKNCIKSGLSTGEGLIWAVRDADLVQGDSGVTDKRLLAVEAEFARPLVVMSRQGNILSEILRNAWDTGDLEILTKTTPAVATDAHISIIAHSTVQDLRRHLTDTMEGNGFGNRFLWLCVRRSKELPEGSSLSDEALAPLMERLRAAVEFAKHAGRMQRDAEARELWATAYRQLTEAKPGLLGAVISRAEAQVLRLSMLYALLDMSTTIRVPHLQAALALWRYSEDSARHIFGGRVGDAIGDAILGALRGAGAVGMTRTEIYNLFQRNQPRHQIAQALAELEALGVARSTREVTGGRPTERWLANA